MAKISLWNGGLKGKDYKFFDRSISEYMSISGTAIYCHLYEGIYDQVAANGSVMEGGITSIQDPVLLENRDRKYSDVVYELRGTYNVSDLEANLSQFSMFIDDTIKIEFHLNDMLARCGRRLIIGDVIELPHLRDDSIPGASPETEPPAINKFYVITDAHKATDGYSATWYGHIWVIKCKPMTASQEFADILGQEATDPFGLPTGNTIGDIMDTGSNDLDVNEQVLELAINNFRKRNYETQQFWIKPGSELAGEYPWVFAGDGIPPNGYESLGSGKTFPEGAAVGDYYLRTDYRPSTLFRRLNIGWQIQEINYREQDWTPTHRLMWDFVNNTEDTTFKDGDVQAQRQGLSKTVTIKKPPETDF
jgi:hypothetical protein